MPETIILSKRQKSDLRNAGTKVETKLPRCVQRRLLCSQVPVKCHPRPSPYRCVDHRVSRTPYRVAGLSITNQISYRTPSSSINKVKNSIDRAAGTPVFMAVGTPRCKKSLSMMDLSVSAMDPDIADLKSESSSTVSRLDEVVDRTKDLLANGGCAKTWTNATPSSESDQGEISPMENPMVKAANVVCHMLVLNAWRRRRAEIAEVEQQVEHLHLQIEFLRRLLSVENDRVGRLNNELHREKIQLEETTRERDIIKSEKEKLEAEVKDAEEISQERSVTIGNLRNDLLSTQDQLKGLDSQIARDREKLLKLREDKKILLDKVSANEALATECGARAKKAESTVEELQLRLTAQIALTESTQERLECSSKQLQATEMERHRLEKCLKSSESNAKILSLRTVTLENQLADREAALRHIESEYNSQMIELNELRERLLRQSQESGWSSRMLQIVGNIMRVSIIRTFSFLSSAALPP